MKSDLLIRADGSAKMGLGHLVRCTSLSTYLKDRFNIIFACKSIPSTAEAELVQQGFSVVRIDQDKDFLDMLRPSSIAILDGYSFSVDFHKEIKERALKLACIDDLHEQDFYSDLIINHAPGIKESDYSAMPFTTFALGLDYVLLRPPFLKAAVQLKSKPHDSKKTILICFGGSDMKNLTLRALKTVIESNRFRKIIVITGAAYIFEDELLPFVQNKDEIHYFHALGGQEMASAFMKSSIAIVPSSGILFEALATGNIPVSGTYVENQKEMYSGFKKLGAIIDAGKFSEDEIKTALRNIDTEKKTKRFIDGKSPDRIRNLFDSLLKD